VTLDTLALVVRPSADASDTLTGACKSSQPGIACRLVWDVSHSARAADLAQAFFNGPATLVLRIAWILLLALLARFAAHRLINRFIGRASEESANGTDRRRVLFRERRQQRAAALASILRNVASITIFSIAFVMILGDLGLNLAPILASVGVLGIAIGFGAQNLVQDFLAGIFMLLEDQYGVGDVVNIGTITGTVEGISLRITRVRDVTGIVWHIRNGTITQAGNESHGWARAVVDFPVPYQSDIAAVRQIMQDAAAALWQDAGWNDTILDKPEVWGVQDLSADAVVMRVTARTTPARQWEVARELRARLKRALDDSEGALPPDAAAPVLISGAITVRGAHEEGAAGVPAPPGPDTPGGAQAASLEPS
jgi:small-conductance mechanosensitive channel